MNKDGKREWENISKMEQFFADEMATTLRRMANKLHKTPWHATEENSERSSLITRVAQVEAELKTVTDSLYEFYTYLNNGTNQITSTKKN